jgi:uncharacterized protein YciI
MKIGTSKIKVNDMKKVMSSWMPLLLITCMCYGQEMDSRPVFDSALAARVGADEYGMKHYVLAFLKSGKTKIEDEARRNELMKAHLKNIQRMANEGKLVVAGPFLDKQSFRGIYIFNVTSIEEAEKLTMTDPAIQAGTLEMELHPWYGSAALMEVVRIHKTLERADPSK